MTMIRVAPIAILSMLAVASEAAAAEAYGLTKDDRTLLVGYAHDTWRSVDAIAAAGLLPADGIWRSSQGWTTNNYTSPTNIAAYLWSTIAAEHLDVISHEEATRRLTITLETIGRLDRSNGFFYNWYDPRTGERLRVWPATGSPLRPFLSSVDNGWLAAGLMIVGKLRPELKVRTDSLLGPMNFRFFYDPYDPANPVAHPGLLRGGYFTDGGGSYADFHYGMLNTEPRIASYIGIARGDLPPEHYYRLMRSSTSQSAPTRTYKNVPVPEGSVAYRGMHIVPSWDGTMFEALMVPLFVAEATWAPDSWGANHRLYARAQIEYGLSDAHLGYWGISASTDGRGGYLAFGVPPLGVSGASGRGSDGSASRVITPHASFLALPFAPREAIDNLKSLAKNYPMYTPYGFMDAVDVGTGHVSDGILMLDQAMILAAIANVLGENILQNAFSAGAIETAVRPLLSVEQFGVGPKSVLNTGRSERLAHRSIVSLPAALNDLPTIPAAAARVGRPGLTSRVDEVLLPFGMEERTDPLTGRRNPVRRRPAKSSERRRAIGKHDVV
jgi:hypothetical protein